jgi:PKD repeat protein
VSLQGTDLALLSARIGVARIGAFRLGFAPDDVEGPGTVGPGEYGWQEVKPEDDGEEWHVVSAWSMCAEKCVASFTVAPDPINVGAVVQFTDTTIPAAEITFWHWDFDDGSYSDLQNPTHVYAHAGDYSVVLWVSGPRGSCHTPLALAPLAPGAPWVPGAPIVVAPNTLAVSFAMDPDPNGVSVDAQTDVTFTPTVTPGVGPYIYAWTFGDGDTSTDEIPIHRYDTPLTGGHYTATLVVTDSLGFTAQAQVTFDIAGI